MAGIDCGARQATMLAADYKGREQRVTSTTLLLSRCFRQYDNDGAAHGARHTNENAAAPETAKNANVKAMMKVVMAVA